jgi:hypothetical protein
MSSVRRYVALATVVVPIAAIMAGAHRAPSQVSVRADTMPHVRMDTATLAAQRRRAWSADLARQRRLDSLAERRRDLDGRRRFYYGLAGGFSQPVSDLHAGYTTGWNVTVPVGWDFVGTPVGIRVDAAWDRLTGQTSGSTSLNDLTIWSLNADASLRRRVERLGPSGTVYVLGGGGVHRIVATAINGAASGANPNGFATSFGGAETRSGFNGGAGASLTVGELALFIETRYVWFRSGNVAAGDARFLPMILGVTF